LRNAAVHRGGVGIVGVQDITTRVYDYNRDIDIVSNIPEVNKKKLRKTFKKFKLTVKPQEHDKQHLKCTYCHEEGALVDTVKCYGPSCGAIYHRDCWHEGDGGCVLRECSSTRATTFTEVVKPKKGPSALADVLTFVLTGKMSKPRKAIVEDITAAGYRVTSTVSGKTSYLVTGDSDSGFTTKYYEALTFCVPKISEKDLYTLLRQQNPNIPEIIMLDGYDEEDGYALSVNFVRVTPTLLIATLEDGETLRFNRYNGLQTPATRELIGSWMLADTAMELYGLSG
jgi:hypothetical protein